MDQAPQENPPKDFNKIDLSQLQGFSFGTQWTQDKTAPQSRDRGERSRRDGGGGEGDRRDDRPAERRDRRSFKRPAGPGDVAVAPAPDQGDPRGPRQGPGEGRPFRQGGGRSFDRGQGGRPFDRGQGGSFDRGQGDHRGPVDRGPYDSPYFTSTFYPEDTSFSALAKTIRSSCRTFELFEIARTVIGKPDRFVAVVQRKVPMERPQREPAEGAGAAARLAPAAGKPAPLFLSVPDGVPFDTEEAAIAHVLEKHLANFFDSAEVEIEPPKGNFQVINRCGVTGDLLGPPNYHLYSQIVTRHHAARAARLPFEAFKARIETVRDPEVVNQWLEKMKKATRFTWKTAAKPKAPETPAAAATSESSEAAKPAPEAALPDAAVRATPAPAPAAEQPAPAVEKPATEGAPVEAAPVEAARPEPVEGAEPPPFFDAFEDARAYLLSRARDRVVRPVEHARFHGKLLESLPPGEIRRAVEGNLERQRRFPLDTANALRGRLRREGFTIFKKGSKGVSYVCAVKRKFRVPGQVFSESIGSLISFVETNPMIKAGDLPARFLGLGAPAAPAADASPEKPAGTVSPFSPEDRAKVSRLQADLAWLVHEGYVTEFIDGGLFAPPAVVEARKKEIESADHDPENFPDAPAQPAPADSAAPVVDAHRPEAVEAPSPEPAQAASPEAAEPAPVTTPPETPVS